MNPSRRCRIRARGLLPLVLLTAWAAGGAGADRARAQSTPRQEPFGPPSAPAPAPPAPAPALPAPVTSREAELEARLRQMEAMVQQLSRQVQALTPPAGGAASAGGGPPPDPILGPGSGRPGEAPSAGPTSTAGARTGSGDVGGAASSATPSATGGPASPGQSLPPNPAPNARFQRPATLENRPGRVKFGPGFEIRTEDEEFILQFHNLTQFDFRGHEQGGQNPVHDTFSLPRQWWMFSGRITKPIGYFVSFAEGFDTLNLLDVFTDLSYSPKFQVRLGRFKTPFTYEFLVEPIQGLISPERSVFFNNFAQNRDIGAMAFGRLFDNHFDYAVGVFNGNRNGYLSNMDAKNVSAFLNWKPFQGEENTLFENLNLGGSVFAGEATQPTQPQILRTAVPTTGTSIAGIPFLAFNNNIRESGYRSFWDAHLAWYYKQLTIIAEYGGGVQRYAPANLLSSRTPVNVQSFYVQASYFLTGETSSGLGVVKPLHPFNPKPGKDFGLGAFELQTRYAYMDIGQNVFSSGLADPNLWSNRLYVLDAGINWHLTQYMKVYLDWQHSEFGNPVEFAPGPGSVRRQLTSDTFWFRFQLYF